MISLVGTKEVNSVLYRLVYIVPANALVQITSLFRTGKNTNRTGEIWLFRPVNGYRAETQKVSFVRKENREEGKKEEDDNGAGVAPRISFFSICLHYSVMT